MSLFILTETSAGYALLKAKDKKLFKREQLPEDANSAEGITNLYVILLFFTRWKRIFFLARWWFCRAMDDPSNFFFHGRAAEQAASRQRY